MIVPWDNWNLVGKWLGRRSIEKEIGYPVYNSPEYKWVISDAGFCSYTKGEIKYLYVLPEHRGVGMAKWMVSTALGEHCGTWTVRANKNSYNLFLRFGFAPVSSTKNFTFMRRECSA